MKSKIIKIIFIILILMFCVSMNKVYAVQQEWKNIDYATEEINDGTVKGLVLYLADAIIDSKEDAELYINKWNQLERRIKENYGAKYTIYSFAEIETQTRLLNNYDKSEKLKNGEKDNDNNEEEKTLFNATNWWSISPDKYKTISYIDDAQIAYEFLTDYSILPISKMGKDFLNKYVLSINNFKESPIFSEYDRSTNGMASKKFDSIYREIYNDKDAMEKLEGTEAKDIIKDSPITDTDAGGYDSEIIIYKKPSKVSKLDKDNIGDNIEDAIEQGNEFIQGGEAKELDLVKFSDAFYNIFLTIGTALTAIIGIVLGINFMVASTERKAEIKQLLIPYIVGCVVIYGALGIWKVAVVIMGNVL